MKWLTFKQECVSGPLISGRSTEVKGGRILSPFHPDLHNPSREGKYNQQRDSRQHKPKRLILFALASGRSPSRAKQPGADAKQLPKKWLAAFCQHLICKEETIYLGSQCSGPPWLTAQNKGEGAKGSEFRYFTWKSVRTFIPVLVCFHVVSEKMALRN